MPQDYVHEDTLGSRGPAPMRFLLPAAAVALHGSSDVALVEAGAHRVTVLSATGHFKRTLKAPLDAERFSSRPFNYPMGIANGLDDGETIIVRHPFIFCVLPARQIPHLQHAL